MRKVIVELNDEDMASIEEVARSRKVDAASVLKVEALRAAAKYRVASNSVSDAPASASAEASTTPEQRRQARLAVLMRSHGILADEPGKPKDGLIYQNELRAEWP